jgi:hypothetical protein
MRQAEPMHWAPWAAPDYLRSGGTAAMPLEERSQHCEWMGGAGDEVGWSEFGSVGPSLESTSHEQLAR